MARLMAKAGQVARSITGFSTAIFGVQWQPPKDQREIVRGILTFLEDRRALYNPYSWEITDDVYRSVQEIRGRLTAARAELPEDSPAQGHLRGMLAACRTYVGSAEQDGHGRQHAGWHHHEFMEALGAWRAVMGMHIAALSESYGVNVEGELRRVLPSEDI